MSDRLYKKSQSGYRRHSLALKPLLLPDPWQSGHLDHLLCQHGDEQDQFVQFLRDQGLAGHWNEVLAKIADKNEVLARIRSELGSDLQNQTLLYLQQKAAIRHIHEIFQKQDIAYLIFKGAHIREQLYATPAVRPSADIDVLINERDRHKALKLLIHNGFTASPALSTISNDLNLLTGSVHVDLHWNVLREGRTRESMTELLVQERVQYREYFGTSPEHTLFLMLIHPVFRKYLTTPHASLCRIVDLHFWLEEHRLDWDKIISFCRRFHLKTAAWTTAVFYNLLVGYSLPEQVMNALSPSPLKASYLKFWLRNNLSSKLLPYPILPKVFFTLPAHDRVMDATFFLTTMWKLKNSARKELREVRQLIEETTDAK